MWAIRNVVLVYPFLQDGSLPLRGSLLNSDRGVTFPPPLFPVIKGGVILSSRGQMDSFFFFPPFWVRGSPIKLGPAYILSPSLGSNRYEGICT